MTPLCELAQKWGTDKALFYTPFYHSLFGDRRQDVRKVLELGIGYEETMLGSVIRMGRTSYTAGASLFMWQEYFPNALIYALDNKPYIFINQGRIESYFVDQDRPETFDMLIPWQLGYGFDFIIEDGNHTFACQLLSAMKLVPLVAPGGVYVIEDVGDWHERLRSALHWPSELVEFGDARIIVVKR